MFLTLHASSSIIFPYYEADVKVTPFRVIFLINLIFSTSHSLFIQA